MPGPDSPDRFEIAKIFKGLNGSQSFPDYLNPGFLVRISQVELGSYFMRRDAKLLLPCGEDALLRPQTCSFAPKKFCPLWPL